MHKNPPFVPTLMLCQIIGYLTFRLTISQNSCIFVVENSTIKDMNVFLNIIWVVFGGLMIAFEYALASVGMMITIIGIPFGLQTMKLAILALWPFGTDISHDTWPSGCLSGIMNVVWWFIGGFVIALTHLGWGILLCCTIIGIPFGLQHFKLMKLALLPFGRNLN